MKAKLHSKEVMTVDKSVIKQRRLVYLLIASQHIKYPWGRSLVFYVGQTARGVGRIATSVAHRSSQIFERRGIQKFHVRVVTCPRRQRVKTWEVLEDDLLRAFKAKYGKVPMLNESKKNINPNRLSGYFSRDKLQDIMSEFHY